MHGPPDIIIAVAGNKCDMEEKRVRVLLRGVLGSCNVDNTVACLCWCVGASLRTAQKVPTADAAAYAKSINALFLETSAKQDTNVQDLFLQISACACVLCFLALLGVSVVLTREFSAGKRLPAPGAGGAFEDDDPVVNLRKAPSKKGGCCS